MESVKRLWPVRWLNDEVINEYMKLISKGNPDTLCLQTFFFAKIEQGPTNSARILQKALKNQTLTKESVECILIPVNKNKSHWILFAALPSAGQLFVLDSLRKDDLSYKADMDLLRGALSKVWPAASAWETLNCK